MADPATAQSEPPVEASPANANRVWVGNLAYKSSEQDLREAFVGMKIAEVSLPARFGRRQGYAFITFEDADDVDKAVAEVNGKDLLGREMRVQKATSSGPYPSENGEHAGDSPSGETKKSRPKSRAKVLSAESLRCLPPADPQAQGTRRPTRDATSGEEAAGSDNSAADPSKEEDAKEEGKPRRRRVQPKKPATEGPFDEADPTAEPKTPAKRASRKGPPEDGIPSTTTIYVANIPFEYTDERLKELFSPYNPTSAYIVPRQIPRFVIKKLAERGEPRKGRGFGFVTFAEESSQKKAVEEMNGHEVDSRAISVKVAIDKPTIEAKENGEESATPVATNDS